MPGIVKTKTGRVVSTKMQKTIVVAVESQRSHRLYKHSVRVTKRFKVHDEHNECREGDVVQDRGDATALQGEAVAGDGDLASR